MIDWLERDSCRVSENQSHFCSYSSFWFCFFSVPPPVLVCKNNTERNHSFGCRNPIDLVTGVAAGYSIPGGRCSVTAAGRPTASVRVSYTPSVYTRRPYTQLDVAVASTAPCFNRELVQRRQRRPRYPRNRRAGSRPAAETRYQVISVANHWETGRPVREMERHEGETLWCFPLIPGKGDTTRKAVVTSAIRLRLYCYSTALRPFDDLRYDCGPTYCGLLHCGLNK